MDDIYEDIVRVGNNLADTLSIKREQENSGGGGAGQQDINSNQRQSGMQPIPMHVSNFSWL